MYKTLLLTFITVFSFQLFGQNNKGHLVIIGGGNRSDYIMEKIIELAGGKDSKIIVVPYASGVPIETAEYQVNQFKELGCTNVDFIYGDTTNVDADSILNKIDNANGVFFSGGDQRRLTRYLLGTKLLLKIKDIYFEGGVISGTSAGAAVMSELMITGDEMKNTDTDNSFTTIEKENVITTPGFGFIKSAIIDQHFVRRQRENRLISLVIENPDLLGIGIDESTSIIVYPDKTFEVLGENQVIVFDASNSKNISVDKNGNLGVIGAKMHVLLNKQKFNLHNKEVVK